MVVADILWLVLYPASLGAFGSAIHLMMQYMDDSMSDNPKKVVVRVVLGAVAGYIYSLTGLPNHLATIAFGYAGESVIRHTLQKVLPDALPA